MVEKLPHLSAKVIYAPNVMGIDDDDLIRFHIDAEHLLRTKLEQWFSNAHIRSPIQESKQPFLIDKA
jgi:hypothetical protein